MAWKKYSLQYKWLYLKKTDLFVSLHLFYPTLQPFLLLFFDLMEQIKILPSFITTTNYLGTR